MHAPRQSATHVQGENTGTDRPMGTADEAQGRRVDAGSPAALGAPQPRQHDMTGLSERTAFPTPIPRDLFSPCRL